MADLFLSFYGFGLLLQVTCKAIGGFRAEEAHDLTYIPKGLFWILEKEQILGRWKQVYQLGGCCNNLAEKRCSGKGHETLLDSGCELRPEPIGFADGWAVVCESEVKGM